MKRHTAHNSNDDINDDIKENDYDHNNCDDNDNNVYDDKDSNEEIKVYKSHIKDIMFLMRIWVNGLYIASSEKKLCLHIFCWVVTFAYETQCGILLLSDCS